MTPRAAILSLGVVVVAGTALRAYRLTERSFWFDEAFSYRMAAEFSVAEMIERTAQDVHPPLYYLVLKGWIAILGTSVLAMRSLSVALGATTMLGVYLFCRDAFAAPGSDDAQRARARGAGVLAAALVATSAYLIRFSWETRMYTLATTLVAFSSWCLVRALSRDALPWWWAGYAGLAVALVYTHNYGLFTVAAQGFFAIAWCLHRAVRERRAPWRLPAAQGGVLAAAFIVAAYASWWPVLSAQRDRVSDDYWISAFQWQYVPQAWAEIVVPINAQWTFRDGSESAIIAAGVAVVLLLLLWRGRRGDWLCVTLMVVPVALAVGVSLASRSVFEARYLIFAHLFVLAAIARLVWRIPFGLEGALAAAVVLAQSLWIAQHYWQDLAIAERPGVRGAVEYVLRERHPNEPIVVLHPCVYLSVDYYCRGLADPHLLLADSPIHHYNGAPVLTSADLRSLDEIRALRAERLWVIDTTGFGSYSARPAIPEPWTRAGDEHRFEDVYPFQDDVTVSQWQRGRQDGPPDPS